MRQVPLEVEDLVFAPLATAQMVLTRQQKDSGALLIDIGGGTTDFICYKGGDVVAKTRLAVEEMYKLYKTRVLRTAESTPSESKE